MPGQVGFPRKAYLSGQSPQARRPFTARLKPSPSFEGLFGSLFASVKGYVLATSTN
jgi:hypothetical protein